MKVTKNTQNFENKIEIEVKNRKNKCLGQLLLQQVKDKEDDRYGFANDSKRFYKTHFGPEEPQPEFFDFIKRKAQ